jgi:hypothetical protein
MVVIETETISRRNVRVKKIKEILYFIRSITRTLKMKIFIVVLDW